MLMLQLASQTCATISKKLVKRIPPPWDGYKLELVKDIQTLTKTTFYIKCMQIHIPPCSGGYRKAKQRGGIPQRGGPKWNFLRGGHRPKSYYQPFQV
ncbi:hypothetical protein EVAR_73818_1 [Eumeta japonica]|uniref:Uncharacterized protein n=1 Tax=Eumeta variegata TaxID=151549 RepID=A0A4C1TJW7_EUMVA|nr:hypothetical protein EVAR_73818_1 [Eumeta japonica]